jgi:hypothetical protein
MLDLFENPELLPIEVQEILNKFSESECTYENCSQLVQELESIGYSCEYGLDAEPYELRKL